MDFGDSGKISKEKLRELKQEHNRIPFQAIECYLADVKPKVGEWSNTQLTSLTSSATVLSGFL